jgi:lysophospholipase L1-like esterase
MTQKLRFAQILVVILSIAFCLAVGELAIRLYLSGNIIYDVEMTRYANLAKLKAENPLIGHVHRPGATAELMGVPVQINSDGFRDDEYPVEKSARDRIVFLGDSLTFGWGVRKEDGFEHRLEQALDRKRPTEIINFGTGNYNTEQAVNLFREKGLKYQPDKVVLFYFINDAEVTPLRSPWGFLGRSRIITFYWSKVHAARNNLVSAKGFKESYADLYAADQPGWPKVRESFEALKEICEAEDIELQVILLPELHELENYPFKKEYGLVAEILTELEIPFLDLTPFFEGYPDPKELWVALDDAHPNALAHKMIAEYSLPFLSEQGEEPSH